MYYESKLIKILKKGQFPFHGKFTGSHFVLSNGYLSCSSTKRTKLRAQRLMLTTLKAKQRHGGYVTNSINLSLATKIQTLQISDNEEKIKMLTT